MLLSLEYLIILDKATNVALYDLVDRRDELKRLIDKNDKFVCEGSKVQFEGGPTFSFKLVGGQVKDKDQRFFTATLSFTGDESGIDEFATCARGFRQLMAEVGAHVETLTNDVSRYYSEKSYTILHNLENLMRKLLNYFMVIQVGRDWLSEASPKEVKETLGKVKRSELGASLFDLDFIDLGGLLFKPYSPRQTSDLFAILETVSRAEDVDLQALRDFQPRSNWERYFSAIVDCSDEFLRKRWEELYVLRCRVAHNSVIGKNDFTRIERLAREVAEKLENAIANIASVKISTQDREILAENLASNISELTGEFLSAFREFERQLRGYYFADVSLGEEGANSRFSVIVAAQKLLDATDIDKQTFQDIKVIGQIRNHLVHDLPIKIDETIFLELIARTRKLASQFSTDESPSTWKDEVVRALSSIGGEAHMVDIYNAVQSQTKRDLPVSWKASVRKTLQSYCSSSKNFLGTEDLFVHVDTGRWGIRDNPEG